MFAYGIKILLHLPLLFFLIAGLGYVVGRRRRRLGRALVWSSVALLWLASTPWVSSALLASLQRSPSLDLAALPGGPGAIVVLGADLTPYTAEMRGPDIGPLTLVRLRYGAQLARASGLPLLVSGGRIAPSAPPLAKLMAEVLEREYGLTRVWREASSRTTLENAQQSALFLRQQGIEEVFLVTHAWHIPRAQAAFEKRGLRVRPAPTAYQPWPDRTLRGFVPSARALVNSSLGLHEWVGRLYYAWHDRGRAE